MAKRSVEKIRRKYGKDCFRKWGNQEDSGSPILKAYKTHRPVKGYKVVKTS
jgi:hypothetical protein